MINKMFDLSSHIRELAESQKDYAVIVEHQFNNLMNYQRRFQNGFELFTLLGANQDTCKPGWRLIPCREAAMVLWHYMHALNSIKLCLDKTPPLRAIVTVGIVEQAIKGFHAAFPDVVGMRNSIGHTAELFKTPAKMKENMLKDFDIHEKIMLKSGDMWMDNLVDGTFSTTGPGGELVKLEMNTSSVEKLSRITTQAFSAISPRKARSLP